MLTPQDVAHIAELSKLSLSDEEKEKFATQLSSVLSFVDQLAKVDTADVVPMAHVREVTNVLRDDVVQISDTETRNQLITNFPAKTGDLLKVKAVFE
jgi:aspartyl-tRNA(Asn)/glutamyl-tRNA(Gln) amidotransferase subunit C